MSEKWRMILHRTFKICNYYYSIHILNYSTRTYFLPRYFRSRFIPHVWKNFSTTRDNKARLESIFHRELTNDWNGKEEEVRSVYAPNVERLIEVDVSCSDRRKVDVIVIVVNVIVTVIISITDIRHRPIEFHSEI